jgi:hypothetical protein
MKTVRRFWARKPLRNPVSGVREGDYSEPLEFIELDGKCIEVQWMQSVASLCCAPHELMEVTDEKPVAADCSAYDAAVYGTCGN